MLTAATWTAHILPDRDPLLGNEASVRLTLTAPDAVMHDAEQATRESFYRLGALPAPYDHLYLKVCVEFVEFDDADARALPGGRVVTAYPTRRFKPGERRKWP